MPTATARPLTDVAPLRLVTLRLARRVRRHSDTGLTPSQLSALSSLDRHGAIRVGRLAECEQIGKSSVTRLVAKLEARGLVERRSDAADGRSWLVALTDRGRELLAESSERADTYLGRQLAALSRHDQQRLQAALPALERLLEVRA